MNSRFDGDAERFDDRAGLSDECCGLVVSAINEICGEPESGLLLEVGTGTGQIGVGLASLPLRYVGFDDSAPMLEQFRERASHVGAEVELFEADGNQEWPVEDGSTNVTFSSRALHLLDQEHVINELFRVAAPNEAYLIIGHVFRDSQNPRAEMRRQMRDFLREYGAEGKSGERRRGRLLEQCRNRGAELMETVQAAEWSVNYSPRISIDSWRSKDGLAGGFVSNDIKESVMSRLTQWAETRFGSLDRQFEIQESYRLEAVRLALRSD